MATNGNNTYNKHYGTHRLGTIKHQKNVPIVKDLHCFRYCPFCKACHSYDHPNDPETGPPLWANFEKDWQEILFYAADLDRVKVEYNEITLPVSW
jgi:cytochrome c2